VGEEPLLEMVRDTNRQPLLILYGKPASGYSIESGTNLFTGAWMQMLTNLTVTTNLFLSMKPPVVTNSVGFYRALRTEVPPIKILGLTSTDGTNTVLSFSGVPGRDYRIQVTPSLWPTSWATIGTNRAGTNGLFEFTDTNGWWQTQRFYRLVWP
jgi:hypothetical protein